MSTRSSPACSGAEPTGADEGGGDGWRRAGESRKFVRVDETERPLTDGERALAASVFGRAIDYDPVRIRRRKWFPFQPRTIVMAPRGHLHFHPRGDLWSDDFSAARLHLQGLFIHEMTHVWQAQTRGSWYLVLMRHPFCRYDYCVKPSWPLHRYGLEQQAEIVRHTFLQRENGHVAGAPPAEQLRTILPFVPT